MWWQKTPHLLAGWDAGEKSLISSCFYFRPRQPYVPSEGPDHPHQGPEAEAPVFGGASGALPAGAQEAVHQRGSKLPSLDLNILFCSLIIHEKHFTCLFFSIHRSWRVLCPQTILWCLMRSLPRSEGELELPSSWTKVWSTRITR